MAEVSFSLNLFDYLLSLLKGDVSRTTIDQTFQSMIVQSKETSPVEVQPASGQRSTCTQARIAQKNQQVNGIAYLARELGEYKHMLDVGCGSGVLSARLAEEFPFSSIKCVDINYPLIIKNAGAISQLKNLSFEYADANNYNFAEKGLVVSLHGCGNLTDRVLDIAIDSGSDVICVPCCFGKIKRKEEQKGYCLLPRSRALKPREDIFRKTVLKAASRLEGSVQDSKRTIQNVMLDAYRTLVNLDRLLYLKEHGYDAKMFQIMPRDIELPDGTRHSNTSLRYALVGKKY